MPPKPDGVEEGVLRGLYRFRAAERGSRHVQLLGSGSILHQALRAQELLAERYDVAADVWSVPSFQQLRNDALSAERWNRLHPEAEARIPYVVQQLGQAPGPIVAATDYLKSLPDMVARWVDRPFTVLGTDGFGRSDTREALRMHFEVSPEQIAYAALHGLCLTGAADRAELVKAIGELGIDPERLDPREA
jgi:pyruvate dehydrogenase E1 component